MSAAQLERTVRAYRRVNPDDAATQHDSRRFSWRCDDDGSVVITLKLEAVQGAAVVEAVQANTVPAKGVAFAAACADRVVALILGHTEAVPVEVVIDVDATVLAGEAGACATEQGVALAVGVVEQHLCDQPVRVATHHPDGSVELSRRRRFATGMQRRRLQARQPHCAFPGCHHQGRLQAHHLVHAHRRGPTVDTNLQLLCATHHRLVHLHHVQLSTTPNGGLHVHHADGRPLDRPIHTIHLSPPEPTHTPTGTGEPLDLHHTLTALLTRVSRGKQPRTAGDAA